MTCASDSLCHFCNLTYDRCECGTIRPTCNATLQVPKWATDETDPIGKLAIKLAARAAACEEQGGEWTWRDIAEAAVPAIDAGEMREKVAAIIDSISFASWESLRRYCLDVGDDEEAAERCANATYLPDMEKARAKADAIISLIAPAIDGREGVTRK